MAETLVRITDIHRSRRTPRGYVVQFDTGPLVDLVGYESDDVVYARSSRTGQFYRVTRTGRGVQRDGWSVRVKVEGAYDPGYADDTIAFGGDRETWGGVVNREVFGL